MYDDHVSRPRTALAPAAALLGLAAALGASPARAEDFLQFPADGTESLGRGAAWVARASTPWAVRANPAAIVTQATSVYAGSHLVFNETCFTRSGPGTTLTTGLTYPKTPTCTESTPTPLPSLGAVVRLGPSLAVGYLVAPPNSYGSVEFPDTVEVTNSFGYAQQIPSPQRYMLLEQKGILLDHVFAVAWEPIRDLRLGAGFIWGMGQLEVRQATMSLVTPCAADGTCAPEDPNGDIIATIHTADWFTPGVVVGAHWSPVPVLDVGLAVRAQQDIQGRIDLQTQASYYGTRGVNPNPTVTESRDIGEGLGRFRLEHPLNARVGARYHAPRGQKPPVEGGATVRDPLADDVFDIGLDFEWTQTSEHERVSVRFPAQPKIVVQGAGSEVPQNNDVELRLPRDTFGVRLGGDWVVLPAQLAVRAGAWYESDAQDPAYLNVTQLATARLGLSVGATYRIGPVDLDAAYAHVGFEDADNGGNGKLLVVAGEVVTTPPFRSPYAINGGRASQEAHLVSLGATARF
ncbi:MAG: outer membrane protein transport protein [Polyangiaceae bacterium]|nr:outer membrane protein transport protein [Polyangiaceae bacterium]